jgi:hypothetical protein
MSIKQSARVSARKDFLFILSNTLEAGPNGARLQFGVKLCLGRARHWETWRTERSAWNGERRRTHIWQLEIQNFREIIRGLIANGERRHPKSPLDHF